MTIRTLLRPAGPLVVCALAASAWANATITGGSADVSSQSAVGNQGSADSEVDNPPGIPVGPTGVATGASTSAGPVEPGDLPTLPGVTGVATSSVGIGVDLIDLGAGIQIMDATVFNVAALTSGTGIYTAGTNSVFFVQFTVPVNTPYLLEGEAAFREGDPGNVRILGTSALVNGAGDNGPFSFTGTLVPSITYTFRGSANVLITETDGAGPSSGSSGFWATLYLGDAAPSPCPGDTDNDGDTDVFDFANLAGAFGTSPGDAGWFQGADLNNDGVVDVFDFAELAADFGCGS